MKEPSECIVMVGLMPHAPVLIPEIAGPRLDQVQQSIQALRVLSQQMVNAQPTRLVLISPHSPRRPKAFGLWTGLELTGNFERFGYPDIHCTVPNDLAFLDQIQTAAKSLDVPLWQIPDRGLDHGALVPLYFLAEAGWRGPTTVLGLDQSGGDGVDKLGECLARAAAESPGQTILVASGDMSHRLTDTAPAGFHPRARAFDQVFVNLIKEGDYGGLRSVDKDLRELAAEDVWESTLAAVGSVRYGPQGHHVLNYEAPFGVGYCVAILFNNDRSNQNPIATSSLMSGETTDSSLATIGTELLAAARQAVIDHLYGSMPDESFATNEFFQQRRGVFVTIRNRDGQLRGCRGTTQPQHQNLLDEVRAMALASAFKDSRFDSLRIEDLDNLVFEVSVLYPPEDVSSTLDLNPFVFGVIVKTKDGRRGVMLPNVDGLDTVEKQLEATRRKAFIQPGEPVVLQRFRVDKFKESV